MDRPGLQVELTAATLCRAICGLHVPGSLFIGYGAGGRAASEVEKIRNGRSL